MGKGCGRAALCGSEAFPGQGWELQGQPRSRGRFLGLSPPAPPPSPAGSGAPEPSRASPGLPEHPRPRRPRRASPVPLSIPTRGAPPAQAAAPHGPPRLTPLCSAPSPAPPPPPAAVPPPSPPPVLPRGRGPTPARPAPTSAPRLPPPGRPSGLQLPAARARASGAARASLPALPRKCEGPRVLSAGGATVRSRAWVRGGIYRHGNR